MCAGAINFSGAWPLASQDCVDKTAQIVGKGQESGVEGALEDKVCCHVQNKENCILSIDKRSKDGHVCACIVALNMCVQ